MTQWSFISSLIAPKLPHCIGRHPIRILATTILQGFVDDDTAGHRVRIEFETLYIDLSYFPLLETTSFNS